MSLKTKASPRSIERARISLEQAADDLKVAKASKKSDPNKSGLQSAQAAINALSSVLEAEGYFQLPAFSTVELLDQCVEVNAEFESLRSPCYVLDGTTQKDLFGHTKSAGAPLTAPFARACYEAAETVVLEVQRYWKQHKP